MLINQFLGCFHDFNVFQNLNSFFSNDESKQRFLILDYFRSQQDIKTNSNHVRAEYAAKDAEVVGGDYTVGVIDRPLEREGYYYCKCDHPEHITKSQYPILYFLPLRHNCDFLMNIVLVGAPSI